MGQAPSCAVGQYVSGNQCLPCPADQVCPGGGAGTNYQCPTGQVVVNNTCQAASPASCTYTCPTGFTLTISGSTVECSRTSNGKALNCNYDTTGKLSQAKTGCASSITTTCSTCNTGEYEVTQDGKNYCLAACSTYQIRASSGLCTNCPANTTPSGTSQTCVPCGTLSLTSAAGSACKCNPQAGAVKQTDGTCGCPSGEHTNFNGVCAFCSTSQMYSASIGACVSCSAGMKSDGMGGPCVLVPSALARQKEKRTNKSPLLESRVSHGYRSSSRDLQTKRNAALQRQKRSTWA